MKERCIISGKLDVDMTLKQPVIEDYKKRGAMTMQALPLVVRTIK